MADDKKSDDHTVEMGSFNRGEPRSLDPPQPAKKPQISVNSPSLPVLSYCASSILMTVTNKFVLSGTGFNLNFFLLLVQVCMAP